MVMRSWFLVTFLWLTGLWLAGPLSAAADSNDKILLQAEQQDARVRENAELNSRINDLEHQAKTIRTLTDRQQQYIEQLQAQIDALEQHDRQEPQP